MAKGFVNIKFQKRIWVVPELELAIAVVPKCACTSIKKALYPITGKVTLSQSLHTWGRVPDDYVQILPVRDPWERLRSFYANNMQLKLPKRALLEMGVRYNMSFVQMLRVIADTPDDRVDKHFVPLWYMAESPKWNGKPNIENFDKIKTWWKGYGLPRLPHCRRPLIKKPDWTQEAVDIIGERYRKDIDYFNFKAPKPWG